MDIKVNFQDRFGIEKMVPAGLFIKKPDLPGQLYCSVCEGLVKYGFRGKNALMNHLETEKHLRNFMSMINKQPTFRQVSKSFTQTWESIAHNKNMKSNSDTWKVSA